MVINEKTLKTFITKKKKVLLESRRKSFDSEQFHWWSGYQEMLWCVELFLEGEENGQKTYCGHRG